MSKWIQPEAWKYEEPLSVGDYIEAEVPEWYGSNNDNGQIERIERVSDKTLEAFGRLIECLAQKGTLTGDEIYEIATGYPGNAELVEAPKK